MQNFQINRKDKLIKEKRHNVFPAKGDWREPTMCTMCGASYSKGRWTWEEAGEDAEQTTCPACRRISSNFPAGYVEIKGTFFNGHEDEILNLIHNVEKIEKQAHPLERIMNIWPNTHKTLVTTTGIHIARRIGEALSRAYQGDMSFQYAEGEKLIRVYWERD